MESLLELTRRALLTGSAAGATGWLVMRSGLHSETVHAAGLAETAPAPPSGPMLELPERRANAHTGSAFLDELERVDFEELDDRVVEEILAGNVPSFLRALAPVDLDDARVWVTRDYMSVGRDDNYVHVPLTGPAAQRLADALHATLPTPSLVDAIHRAADVHLPAVGVEEEPELHWVAQKRRHEQRLAHHDGKELVSGHLKDIVVSPVLRERRDRVAVYGLQGTFDHPLQPFSTIHELIYVDYSHGVRLVAAEAERHGKRVLVDNVLPDLFTYPRR
jgi:hypothetical protein